MDKLKAIAAPIDHFIEGPLEVTPHSDRLTQLEFVDGLKELCDQFNLPDSLISALVIGNVANIVNRSEGKDSKYNTLADLSQCMRYGDGNWMKFIPVYKQNQAIYTDRLDIGLYRAFYSFAISQGLDPIDAFNVTKARSGDIQEFLKYAALEVHELSGKVTSVWFDYRDLLIYAGRRVLENPVKPADFKIKFIERKGPILS